MKMTKVSWMFLPLAIFSFIACGSSATATPLPATWQQPTPTSVLDKYIREVAPTPIPVSTSTPYVAPAPIVVPTPTPFPYGENLMENGSFEFPEVEYSGQEDPEGWDVGSVNNVNLSGATWEAGCGAQSLDLSDGSVSQLIPTVEGATYYVYVKTAGIDYGGEKKGELWFGNQLSELGVTEGSYSTTSGYSLVWDSYEFQLIAEQNGTVLKLRGISSAGKWGLIVDCVEVYGPKGELPTLTPPPTPVQAATPVPGATPSFVIPTPAPPAGADELVANELVLLENLSKGEKIYPGQRSRMFPLYVGGGCRCDLEFEVDAPSWLRTGFGASNDPVSIVDIGDDITLSVPDQGSFVFLFVWVDPGTSAGREVEDIVVAAESGGQEVSSVTVAENFELPQSLQPAFSWRYDRDRGVVHGSGGIRNLGGKSQSFRNLEVEECSFRGNEEGAVFTHQEQPINPSDTVTVQSGRTFTLGIDVTVPVGTTPSSALECDVALIPVQENQTLEEIRER